MPKYIVEAMPAPLSAEVVALLEKAETATIGHWRHWGFVDRGVRALLRGRRVAGTAVTVQIPGPDSTLLHHALGLLRPGDILVVDRLGGSSVRYEIGLFRNDDGTACAEGHFVHVYVDRREQSRTVPVPERLRTAVTAELLPG